MHAAALYRTAGTSIAVQGFINCYVLGYVVFVTTTVIGRRTLTDVYIPFPPFDGETSSLTEIAVSIDVPVGSSSSTTSWQTETGSVNNNTRHCFKHTFDINDLDYTKHAVSTNILNMQCPYIKQRLPLKASSSICRLSSEGESGVMNSPFTTSKSSNVTVDAGFA